MSDTKKTAGSGFLTVISVFFFWGFVAASNDILIPVFKEKLQLAQWQSQMVSFAFYVAYTVGSLIYFFISKARGKDILNSMGYKNGIALGLVISALGTLLFYPAAETASFGLMITGLFIVGLGFSLQQTAANPLVINMGGAERGAQRLSLAGGINNFGTTIGPVVVSLAIFGAVNGDSNKIADIGSIKTPYLVLGAAFVLVALLFKTSSIKDPMEDVKDPGNEPGAALQPDETITRSLTAYPQLILGMIAIFLYVGVEVSTASNLPEYMRQYMGFETGQIAPYVSLYWASLMIGRWTASVGAMNIGSSVKQVFNFLMPYLAFGVFLLVNAIAQHDISSFYVYGLVIVAIIIGNLMSRGNPARQLLIFAGLGIASLVIGMATTGLTSVFAFISAGLFCSTLWPCIFTLAIAGLGKRTNEGSSLLIMMIMGGGVVSLLQGALASNDLLGIRMSYLVGVACFAYLAWYGFAAKRILMKQGIDYDSVTDAASKVIAE